MRAGKSFTTRIALLILAMLATLTPAATAQSLYKYAPATQWGYTFAGPATLFKTSSAVPRSANLEKRSDIQVNYTNFPEWAKNELQLAVDVWSANFESKVTITIEIIFFSRLLT
jgi:hypothetical protein